MGWLGIYKSHFTETVSDPAGDDPDTGRAVLPNLVTDVQTTHAAVPDVAMTGVVHDSLEAAGLLPRGASIGENCDPEAEEEEEEEGIFGAMTTPRA